ncbi:MAG: ATP-binding protein, partial [Candidatus Binatia bacterium]
LRFPELERLLDAEPGRVDRLRGLQRAYFLSLTDASFDTGYFESRLRIGNVHQEIGLEPTWYIGAFALYFRLALRALVAETGDGARILPTVEALLKAIFLDMALAMRTYIAGGYIAREVADQLRRAVEIAAETERLKDELTAMVVHDLKNPVNGISMMVQLALRKAADLPESHRGYLQQIDLTCREMMRLIQNILEIARFEEGKMPIAREPVVLAELVDEVVREYAGIVGQAGRTLAVDVASDLPAALADRALLRRVLVNLIVNALHHSGSVAVRVDAASGPDQVTLRVCDDGRGIPPEQQAIIFEKFASIRRSPTEEPSEGTGLGLPFCRLAVERMGGRIALTSIPGSGAVFAVTLPAYPRT